MEKMSILKVGTIDDKGQPKGWSFSTPGGYAMSLGDRSEDLQFGGYTVQELTEIAKRTQRRLKEVGLQ